MRPGSITNRNSATFDKLLEIRDMSEAPLSATATTTPIEFAATEQTLYRLMLTSAGYTGFVLPTATWEVALEVSDAEGGAYIPFPSTIIPESAQKVEIGLSGKQINALVPNANWVRLSFTKTGTPGNLTIGAFFAH